MIETYNFYQSSKWVNVAKYIRRKYNYTCQKCGKRGTFVHHINPLTQEDYINKPLAKCYGEDNLTCLCYYCHERIHSNQEHREGTYFDSDGNIMKIE